MKLFTTPIDDPPMIELNRIMHPSICLIDDPCLLSENVFEPEDYSLRGVISWIRIKSVDISMFLGRGVFD